jgi:hypothetical protein
MPQTLGFQGLLPNPADAIDRLNPIGWWRLNDSSGSTAVATVGNDGTYVGSPTLEAGPLAIDGQSVEFNDSPYITVPAQSGDINAAADAFTITAFIELSSVSEPSQLIWEEGATVNGASLYLNNATLYGLAWTSSTFISRIRETSLTTGTLYHIAYGYDATVPSTVLYINGTSVGSVLTNSGTSLAAHGGANGIGGVNGSSRNNFNTSNTTGAWPFVGRIGDVARFSGLLTQDEVRSIARQNMAI